MNYITTTRHIIALLTAMIVAAIQITALGDHIDDLYAQFGESVGKSHVAAANAIYAALNDEQFTDSLFTYNTRAKADGEDALVHYWMAEWYMDAAQYPAAIAAGIKAVDSSHGTLEGTVDQSDMMAILCYAYFRNGSLDDALQQMERCYELDKRLGDNERVSSDLNSLASIYLAARQPKPGITYINRAIAMERELGRSEALAVRLGMASELYLLDDEPGKAMELIDEAYQLDTEAGRTGKAAIRLSQKGAILLHEHKLPQARQVLTEAAATLQREGIIASLTICYNQLGQLEVESGNMTAARDYYTRALSLAKQSGNRRQEQSAERGLWQALRETNPDQAMTHLERYSALADSLNEDLRSKQLSEFRVKYHTDELTAQNDRYRITNRLLIAGTAIATALLLAAVGAFIYAMRQRRRAQRVNNELEQVRSAYFTNVTHEFRSPLTVIMSAGERLRNGELTSDQTHELGDQITRHGNNMMNLIDQLLDTMHVQSPVGNATWVNNDVVAHVRMIVDNYQAHAHSRNVELAMTAGESHIVMDYAPDLLNKVVNNLIDNALKYTAPHGHVDVNLGIDDEQMTLTVADNGCGMSDEDVAHIFEHGYRGHNNDGCKGSGVGLALTRQAVEQMGGNVAVESAPGQGSQFVVTLPLRQATMQPAIDTTATPAPTGGATLPLAVIVEDNNDVALYVGSLLKEHCMVHYAGSGREALTKIRSLMPAIVVTDLVMPEMDGYELIATLRADKSLADIPVLVVSGKDSDADRIRAIRAGADAYLVKPFNSAELVAVAQQLIKRETHIAAPPHVDNEPQAPARNVSTKGKDDQEFINKVVNMVYAQLGSTGLDADAIAATLGLSRKQLRNRIQTITGETPTNFIMGVRMSRARRLLSGTTENINEIATKCGFHDVAHFSRTFKQHYGLTPSQFRRQGG